MEKAACYSQEVKYHPLIWPSVSDIPFENHYICLSWVVAKTGKLLNIFYVPLAYIQDARDYSYAGRSLLIIWNRVCGKKNHKPAP